MKTWFGEAPTLFACVHVPEFAAQALLRLRPSLKGRRVAVLEGEAPHERVCAANTPARRDGLVNGMTRVEAESFAGVTLLRRSSREEEAARLTLLGCAGSFTPRVEICSSDTAAVCVLDAAGPARLHRDPQTFAEALGCALENRGLYASIAISANFDAACALAQGRPGITIAAPGEEQKMLVPLLLEALGLSAEQAETLALWGIRTLGGVAALPQKQLIARMGQGGKRLRELARGEARHLFAPVRPPRELREFSFESPGRKPVQASGMREGGKQAHAMRKLRPPEPVHVHTEEGQPVRFWFRGELFRVRSACGPWRLNGAWWSRAAGSYEYWDVAAERSRPETAPRVQINPVQPALYPFLMYAPTPEPPLSLCCRLQRDLGPNPNHEWCVEGLHV